MRRFLAVSLVVFAAVLPLLSYAANAPVLPDYTTAPFAKILEGEGPNGTHAVLYATSRTPVAGAQAVFIYSDVDSKKPVAAEWHVVDNERTSVAMHYFEYKGDAWVYKESKTMQLAPRP